MLQAQGIALALLLEVAAFSCKVNRSDSNAGRLAERNVLAPWPPTRAFSPSPLCFTSTWPYTATVPNAVAPADVFATLKNVGAVEVASWSIS